MSGLHASDGDLKDRIEIMVVDFYVLSSHSFSQHEFPACSSQPVGKGRGMTRDVEI
ncbi:MAG: hypothetical protein ACTSUE_25560 [Promethearchaeota archaeon]